MKKYILPAILGVALLVGGFVAANNFMCQCGPACACSPCDCTQ